MRRPSLRSLVARPVGSMRRGLNLIRSGRAAVTCRPARRRDLPAHLRDPESTAPSVPMWIEDEPVRAEPNAVAADCQAAAPGAPGLIAPDDERTNSILSAVPDAIIGVDARGRVDMISPAVASVFGHDAAAIESVTLTEWLPGMDLVELERRTTEGLYLRARKMHVARFETNARRDDGTEFPADVSLSRVEAGAGVRYTCVVRDITEQRMAYSMLNLYRRALECTANGVVISDMSLPGQPVFYANPAFQSITGYTQDEAIGRGCDFLQRGDTDQPEIGKLREAIRANLPATVVLRNYRKDGTLFFNELAISPVDSGDGKVCHYVGILNDVTERERSRMAIAERSARLNAVFDLSPDGFVVFDAGRKLVYCNRAFLAMTGWAAHDDAPVSLEEFDRRFARLCETDSPVRSLADVLASDEGTADTLVLSLPQRRVLARDVRGQIDGQGETILFLRDVTRETEVDRMKSEFLTTAAHELRTPMVSVYGFTELLLYRPVTEARRRDMLETIHRQSRLLINMVNELLDLARIEARQGKDLKREPRALIALVEEALQPFGEQGASRLRTRLRHADALVHVDADKVLRAFTNVLSNAFKYSPGGGDVTIETLEGRLREAPSIGVRVTDRGVGMNAEQLRRVCERFYRADPSGNIPGTGLGMSLVKEIIELHGGQVDLESEPGAGTAVTIWLPTVSTTALA